MAKYVLQIIVYEYFMYMNYCDETLYNVRLIIAYQQMLSNDKNVIKQIRIYLVITSTSNPNTMTQPCDNFDLWLCSFMLFRLHERQYIYAQKSRTYIYTRLKRSLFYYDH